MPGMTEARIYEALGLAVPETSGANEQAIANPAQPQSAADQPSGVNEQVFAEPAPGSDAAADPGPSDPPEAPEDTGSPADGGEQSPEERRANAARRRQAEQQAAIHAAVAAARQEEQQKAAAALQNLFAQAGMKNTFTGEPITSQQEFEAWQSQYRNDRIQKELSEGKLTVESLNALVEEHPVVKQAKAAMQSQQALPGAAGDAASPNAAQQAQDNARIQAELAEIRKMDPSVKDLGDILNSATGKEFYAKVQQGYSFIDAFRLANFDRLTAQKAQAARDQVHLNDRGKGHMTGAGNSRGSGALSVPAADMAMFRVFNPNATEADIQAYYNKYQKGH